MNQDQRRNYLITELLKEEPRYQQMKIPNSKEEQRKFLRSLMNIRLPKEINDKFLREQDRYLSQINKEKGIVTLGDTTMVQKDLFLWKGDITRLKVGAIVNAANSGMTGCYQPCHNCIDNCIHTYAGIQLRLKCADLMSEQGEEEPAGRAKITPAYNLPCQYVIHTVGPIVQENLCSDHEIQLESCYRSCLALADENKIDSIAFCCISTGVFMFPNRRAAEIAVNTVQNYKKDTGSPIKVIFNVFKDLDEDIYMELLDKRSASDEDKISK